MKKIVVVVMVVVLLLATASVVFARNSNFAGGCNRGFEGGIMAQGCKGQGQGLNLMRDTDGNLLSFEEFIVNLDAAIEDGVIAIEDRETFIEMYERCGTMQMGQPGMMRRGCKR